MNLILFESHELQSGHRLSLCGDRAEHLRTVLQVQRGASLKVGMINGAVGTASVENISPESIELRVSLTECSALPPPTDLFVALPRPQMLKRILEHVSAIGVRRVCLFRSFRVEKSYFLSPLLSPENLRLHLLRGLEQSKATHLPEITVIGSFRDALALMSECGEPQFRIVAHPETADELSALAPLPDSASEISLVIGPEGGFVRTEMEAFSGIGYRQFRLGQRVQRVESAVTFALGELHLLRSFGVKNTRTGSA